MVTQAQQQAFLNKIIPLAIADTKKTKVLASLTIAQAILESAWGLSGLTVRSNNLFGIKGNGIMSPTGPLSGCNFKYTFGGTYDENMPLSTAPFALL